MFDFDDFISGCRCRLDVARLQPAASFRPYRECCPLKVFTVTANRLVAFGFAVVNLLSSVQLMSNDTDRIIWLCVGCSLLSSHTLCIRKSMLCEGAGFTHPLHLNR